MTRKKLNKTQEVAIQGDLYAKDPTIKEQKYNRYYIDYISNELIKGSIRILI